MMKDDELWLKKIKERLGGYSGPLPDTVSLRTHVCREEETDHVPSLGDDGCGSCAGGCIVC